MNSILEKWINPYYLEAQTIKNLQQTCLSRPYLNYLVIDNFFNLSYLKDRLTKSGDDFKWHETSQTFRRPLIKENPLSEIFLSKQWGQYLKKISGGDPDTKGTNIVSQQIKQAKDCNGYWIHSDKMSPGRTKKIISLFYLNKNWKLSDGGMLQIWQEVAPETSKHFPKFRVEDYINPIKPKKLNFLNDETEVTIIEPAHTRSLLLIDQILPIENRLVVMNLSNNPGYHSVTPNMNKQRHLISQFFD